MGFLAIVSGLILLLAGSGWFAGAATVGAILLAVGVTVTAVQLVILAVAARKIKRDVQRPFPRYR